MAVMDGARDTLKRRFGHADFREGQAEVIEALLQGQNAAAVFPTGSGKSLCYQLPAVLLPGVTLVVSPLLALMKDQVDAMQALGVPAARLDSTLTAQEYSDILSQARKGELKLLYVAPERFQNERFRHSLKDLTISLFAIDEAHCVSEWGHNFRPDYLKLAAAANTCGAQRILALTATATPRVLDDICRTFTIDCRVRTPFYRENLILNSRLVASKKGKLEELQQCLVGGPTVVYVTLQRTAEELAQTLEHQGYEARPYHAGLPPEQRADTQEWFLRSEDAVVVATIAFGMGIDKPDIRAVVHYDPPKSMEGYSQEIGRAGRDGDEALCEFLYFPPDRIPLENFVYGDTPTRAALDSLVQDIFGREEELVLNLYQLSSDHDIRPLVLRTILTYLELDGYLQERTPIYSSYQFKALKSSKEILAALSGEPQQFMASLLKLSVKKRLWFAIDLEEAQKALDTTRERVVKALDWCHERGFLEVRASDLRHRYRIIRPPSSLEALTAELYAKARTREAAEIQRLEQVISLATQPGCLAARLSRHFGEEIPGGRCERCDDCLGQRDLDLKLPAPQPWSIPELPSEVADVPRQAARFLCGVTSPALSKQKLTRHPQFGSLAEVSFADVLERLEQGV